MAQNGNMEKRKVWWEGNNPGDTIELFLENCTRILAYVNTGRVKFGQIDVFVDDVYTGFQSAHRVWHWLPTHRSLPVIIELVSKLPAMHHVVKLRIRNETDAEDFGHKFDLIAIATSML